ncbi:MAG: exodeoxyribonuclease VII large subunit [Verrucomicrobia bacterium]|nr:exodeoxyribonuclease VII large subunit [Verrucomicrobiota bacterium]
MPRTVQSQWDFGELVPAAQARRVLTVSELTGQVKRLLEQQFGSLWVSGEITNLRLQASGHCYFTLRDAQAQLNCVLFRGEAKTQRQCLVDGAKVVLAGELTVYEPRGQHQLLVKAIELQGVGALQLAFQALKQKLQAEGLFAVERKRPLPRLPQRIGVITSPSGAALRDVLHVLQRRHPGLELVLCPCRVQGDGAAAEMADALCRLNQWSAAQPAPGRLDLLLLTRGGGSLEDLWAFNEEVLARAIYHSALPVVSAVGHEIDFTISDFVADFRAATPTAAAEIVTEAAFATRRFVAEARARLQRWTRQRLAAAREALDQCGHRFARRHPRRALREHWQRWDEATAALPRRALARWREACRVWQATRMRWTSVHPAETLRRHQELLGRLAALLRERGRHRASTCRQRLTSLAARLRVLSPAQVLARGYSITLDAATGQVIRSARQTRPRLRLRTRLHQGEIDSMVADDPPRLT